MNVLLASSNTLSFSCYFWCTALALPKLLIHCSIGTTIRSFAESAKSSNNDDGIGNGGDGSEELEREQSGQRMKAIAGLVGGILCFGERLFSFFQFPLLVTCSAMASPHKTFETLVNAFLLFWFLSRPFYRRLHLHHDHCPTCS